MWRRAAGSGPSRSASRHSESSSLATQAMSGGFDASDDLLGLAVSAMDAPQASSRVTQSIKRAQAAAARMGKLAKKYKEHSCRQATVVRCIVHQHPLKRKCLRTGLSVAGLRAESYLACLPKWSRRHGRRHIRYFPWAGLPDKRGSEKKTTSHRMLIRSVDAAHDPSAEPHDWISRCPSIQACQAVGHHESLSTQALVSTALRCRSTPFPYPVAEPWFQTPVPYLFVHAPVAYPCPAHISAGAMCMQLSVAWQRIFGAWSPSPALQRAGPLSGVGSHGRVRPGGRGDRWRGAGAAA